MKKFKHLETTRGLLNFKLYHILNFHPLRIFNVLFYNTLTCYRRCFQCLITVSQKVRKG